MSTRDKCDRPSPGWECLLNKDHEGPCPAWPTSPEQLPSRFDPETDLGTECLALATDLIERAEHIDDKENAQPLPGSDQGMDRQGEAELQPAVASEQERRSGASGAALRTPYGELKVGDKYRSADLSGIQVKVVDVDTFAEVQDAVVERADGHQYRIDWFKLMMVRYEKVSDECCHQTMLAHTRCNNCPWGKSDDKFLRSRNAAS